MDITEARNLVASKEQEYIDIGLIQRWDDDRRLAYDKYQMTSIAEGDEPNRPVPDVDNVSMQEAKVFRERVGHEIISAKRQTVVESDTMKGKEIAEVEEFLRAVNHDANEIQFTKGEPPLFPFHVDMSIMRGRVAEIDLLTKQGPDLIPNVVPIDVRFFTYQMGKDGMLWGCAKTIRDKFQIEAEYPKAKDKLGAPVSGSKPNQYVVSNFWNLTHNIIWADNHSQTTGQATSGGTELLNQPNPYRNEKKQPYVPIHHHIAPTGTMLKDKEVARFIGDSILGLNRELWAEIDKQATILATLGRKLVESGYVYENKDGQEANVDNVTPNMPGGVTAIGLGEKLTLVELQQAHQTTQIWLTTLMARIQRGALPNVSFGDAPWPAPPSGVAIFNLIATSDPVYAPRLEVLGRLFQGRDRMFTMQFLQLGGSGRLGDPGHRRVFRSADLEGSYTTSYRFNIKPPMVEAANYSLAAAAVPWYDTETIHESILKTDDPQGVIKKRRAEKAEQLDPVIMLERSAHDLVDQADKLDGEEEDRLRMEAKRLTNRAVALINQERMGQPIDVPEQDKPTGADLPLFQGPRTGVVSKDTSVEGN